MFQETSVMSNEGFYIVLFIKSNMVEIVPCNWTFSCDDQCMCYWPPTKVGRTHLVRMVKERHQHSASRKAHRVRILKRFG